MNMHVTVPGTPQDSFAALSAAIHPAWHQAVLRLASATERVAVRMDAWGAATSADGSFLKECRDLVTALIDFIDEADAFAQTECEINGDEADQSYREGFFVADCPMEDDEDGGDDEPSLAAQENHPNCWAADGSQERWATAGNRDEREGDGCADDREGDELLHGGEAIREDDEPSLGWTDEETARGSFYAGSFGRIDMEVH